PKAPSKVITKEGKMDLNEWIDLDPEGIMGTSPANKFAGKLPFLLKILSAAKPLSIQTHPNKIQAGLLHAQDPLNYPDNNHKPEQAIALGPFTAFVGFKSSENIKMIFDKYPELKSVFGLKKKFERYQLRSMVKTVFEFLANCPAKLSIQANLLAERIRSLSTRLPEENIYLDLLGSHPSYDPGIFLMFLLNLIQLKKHESISVPTGIPHSYVQGNIVECMASSDNVVRAGLTPKFVDIKALTEVLDYSYLPLPIFKKNTNLSLVKYPSSTAEFSIRKHMINLGDKRLLEPQISLSIFVVTKGTCRISWSNNPLSSLTATRGQAFVAPANIPKYELQAVERTEVFQVSIP
ncbi:mannose-6-phosphate isomerase, class I, partial [bacterium]|nr:mannose-6-phosphate isomerase, class I [bacterium]